jgi:putative Mg2+ transporter-C (MgtC) family protein
LALALVLGGAVGLERELSHKPAGLRTNILICVGSAMMMGLSGLMLAGAAPGAADALRIAAGVVTGMGFIGAGTIIQSGNHVHGLTTASTLWAVTGLGLVIGAGYYLIAAAYAAMLILILVLLRQVEKILPRRITWQYVLDVDGLPGMATVQRAAAELKIKLDDLVLRREKETYRLGFNIQAPAVREKKFRERLAKLGSIVELRAD